MVRIEQQLPFPQVDIKACIPYDRGDLLARVYRLGSVSSRTDTDLGTVVIAKVPASIAQELEALSL
jgi:GTP-binding protein HflX